MAPGFGGFSLWSVGSIALGLVTKQPFMLGRDEKQAFPLLGRWEVKERTGRGEGPNCHSKGTPQWPHN